MQKPTVVISASPSPDGGEKANASLVQTLKMMMAEIDPAAILCISGASAKVNKNGELINLETKQELQDLLENLIQTVSRI